MEFTPPTEYVVERVMDGSTIAVSREGEEMAVRLLGVKTPEFDYPREVGDFGQEAVFFLRSLLDGRSVYVVSDPNLSGTEQEGRHLAYVYRAPDGLFVNAAVIRNGLSDAETTRPLLYSGQFDQFAEFAWCEYKGMWETSLGRRDDRE